MSVAILVPALRRPHRVAPLLENVAKATAVPHRVVFICSPEDEAEQAAVVAAGADMLVLDRPCGAGDYARKINHGHRNTTESFLLFGADDLRFRSSWFERAVERMVGHVGVVGTNDLGNSKVIAGEHATHPLVARWYADLGTVDDPAGPLHEGYDHNFVDNEFVETAKARQAWAFAPDSVVEHLHPSWSKADWDDVYERGQSGWHTDRRLFTKRARKWLGWDLTHQVPARVG